MSSKGAATLAVVRDSASSSEDQVVRQAEIGKAPTGDTTKASFLDALAQVVPTGVIAGYSAILAALIAAIKLPDGDDFEPDQLLLFRVPLWIVFVALAFFLAQRAYMEQSDEEDTSRRRRVPLEVWVSALAFAVWGLASPGTWVTEVVKIDNDGLRPVLLLSIAVIGTLILSGLSSKLAKKLPPPPGPPGLPA